MVLQVLTNYIEMDPAAPKTPLSLILLILTQSAGSFDANILVSAKYTCQKKHNFFVRPTRDSVRRSIDLVAGFGPLTCQCLSIISMCVCPPFYPTTTILRLRRFVRVNKRSAGRRTRPFSTSSPALLPSGLCLDARCAQTTST